MKVLVACEFSGRVRDEFLKRGHEAWSCDLLHNNSPFHIVDNVLNQLDRNWDLMIAFPPCTHLCVSGARYFSQKQTEQATALEFVKQLMNADIPRICIENPVGIISSKIRKPSQIIQPWQFDDDASKKTCLWLKNLPPLKSTNVIVKDRYANQTASGQNNLPPSKDRAMLRSITYPGIAEAMADQWGSLPVKPSTLECYN